MLSKFLSRMKSADMYLGGRLRPFRKERSRDNWAQQLQTGVGSRTQADLTRNDLHGYPSLAGQFGWVSANRVHIRNVAA